MKQTYDVPEKIVVMELEQLSLNDVQQSIEERQKKKNIIYNRKKGRKKVLQAQSSCKQTKIKGWNNTRIAKRYS